MNERERCDIELEPGVRCVLPLDHPGDDHEYQAALPPDIAQLLAKHIETAEEARAYFLKQARFSKISGWVSLTLIAIYLALNIQTIVRILSGT